MGIVSASEFAALVGRPALETSGLDPAGGGWLAVELDGADDGDDGRAAPVAGPVGLAVVLIGIGVEVDDDRASPFDVVVADEAAAAEVGAAVDTHPHAAVALALLLRGGGARTTAEGLIAESATYSMLQAGSEHRRWLSGRQRRERSATGTAPVRVERAGDRLVLTLARPEVRNAFDAATRDALLDALAVAELDPTIISVVLAGDGPSFCSGGDLDEFGSSTDPAAAHVLRVARSVGAVLDRLASRVQVHVHGACIGAGMELPAFAGSVVARADASFALPEVGMGLVPGAGGTVSIPRRIGRHRTAWLALTGARIDAATALDWGLVDEVVDVLPA